MKQSVESLVLGFLKQKDPTDKYFVRNKSFVGEAAAYYTFEIRKKSEKWFNLFSRKIARISSINSGSNPEYKSFDPIISEKELKKLVPKKKYQRIIGGTLLNTVVVE